MVDTLNYSVLFLQILLRVKLRKRKRTDFVRMNDSKKTSLMRGERLIYYYSLWWWSTSARATTYKVSFQQNMCGGPLQPQLAKNRVWQRGDETFLEGYCSSGNEWWIHLLLLFSVSLPHPSKISLNPPSSAPSTSSFMPTPSTSTSSSLSPPLPPPPVW